MRLIDADELLKKLIATDDYEIDGDTYWDYVVYEEDIKKAKTVDAVPVVRCKDCIHRPVGDPYEHDVEPSKENDYKCPCLCEDDNWYSWIPADDWFCANGERK